MATRDIISGADNAEVGNVRGASRSEERSARAAEKANFLYAEAGLELRKLVVGAGVIASLAKLCGATTHQVALGPALTLSSDRDNTYVENPIR